MSVICHNPIGWTYVMYITFTALCISSNIDLCVLLTKFTFSWIFAVTCNIFVFITSKSTYKSLSNCLCTVYNLCKLSLEWKCLLTIRILSSFGGWQGKTFGGFHEKTCLGHINTNVRNREIMWLNIFCMLVPERTDHRVDCSQSQGEPDRHSASHRAHSITYLLSLPPTRSKPIHAPICARRRQNKNSINISRFIISVIVDYLTFYYL